VSKVSDNRSRKHRCYLCGATITYEFRVDRTPEGLDRKTMIAIDSDGTPHVVNCNSDLREVDPPTRPPNAA